MAFTHPDTGEQTTCAAACPPTGSEMSLADTDRAEASDLRALAGQIGQSLGYTIDAAGDGYANPDMVVLRGPDQAALWIRRMPNRNRLSIGALYPPAASRLVYRLPAHAITVAASRGPVAIAADISRRLLPAYRPDLARAQHAVRTHQQAAAGREARAVRLLAAVPGLRRGIGSEGRISLIYYGGETSGLHGSVEILEAGDRARIELTGPAEVVLGAFTAAVAGHTGLPHPRGGGQAQP